MKKSVSIRLICLVVALVALGGAVAFAAVMGSPYETLKKAALDAVTYRNVTAATETTITVNGMVENQQKSYSVSGDEASLEYHFDDEGNIIGFYYTDNRIDVSRGYTQEDGVEWYTCNIRPARSGMLNRYGSSFAMLSPEDRDSAQMRFFELLADALVGDLKNNVTMSSRDGIRLIQGTLTESQVPELIKAGLDVVAEQSGGFYLDNDRKVSFDGTVYVYENITIYQGVKTVTTWKQPVRRMTTEESEALENQTFYSGEYNGKSFYGFTDIDGIMYINSEPAQNIGQNETPTTRADYESADPLEVPMKNIEINYVHGEAEVDADGNLLSVEVTSAVTMTDIFGAVNKIELKFAAEFSDIGTSAPVCPISGVEQLLTPEYLKTNFGDEEYFSV
ncbi:MAG: hypothetical protein FWH57_11675, partial [Oscillospiraceae bacterium]|nr:hypothetical protein [Oscillospiraceae bacterium]